SAQVEGELQMTTTPCREMNAPPKIRLKQALSLPPSVATVAGGFPETEIATEPGPPTLALTHGSPDCVGSMVTGTGAMVGTASVGWGGLPHWSRQFVLPSRKHLKTATSTLLQSRPGPLRFEPGARRFWLVHWTTATVSAAVRPLTLGLSKK